jgi:hypothetical protein
MEVKQEIEKLKAQNESDNTRKAETKQKISTLQAELKTIK